MSEDSIAQHQGLQGGDEILSINGTKVAGMDGTHAAPGLPASDLLINQPPDQDPSGSRSSSTPPKTMTSPSPAGKPGRVRTGQAPAGPCGSNSRPAVREAISMTTQAAPIRPACSSQKFTPLIDSTKPPSLPTRKLQANRCR